MFDRTIARLIRALASIVVLISCAASAAHGQTSAEIARRLSAATAAEHSLRDSARALKKLIDQQPPPDSARFGAITVLYSKRNLGPEMEAMVMEATRMASAAADSEYRDAARLPDVAARLVIERSRFQWAFGGKFETLDMNLYGNIGRLEQARSPITSRKLAQHILNLVGTSGTRGVAQNVVAWAGYWTPSGSIHRENLEDAALAIATSNAAVARACYTGSVISCESALGLTPVKDELTEWYSPDGWRAIVESWPAQTDKETLSAIHECVKERKSTTCERLARSRPIPIPLIMAARSTLLGLAIERGGHGGFARLLAAKGTPSEVLAATAGESIAALVSEWRTRVLAAMPASGAPSASEAGLMLAWTLAFGFVATRKRP